MGTRWARFARGWLAALFATLIAALSHSLAGGAPSLLAIVLSLAFAGMLCIGLAGKKPSTSRLATSVIGSQLLFHQLFSYLGNPTPAPLAGHVHEGIAAPLMVPAPGAWHPDTFADAVWMAVAHSGAAIVTFLLLRHGEAAFWSLTDTARQMLRVLFPPVPEATSPRSSAAPAPVSRVPRSPKARILAAARYRGPPAPESVSFA